MLHAGQNVHCVGVHIADKVFHSLIGVQYCTVLYSRLYFVFNINMYVHDPS